MTDYTNAQVKVPEEFGNSINEYNRVLAFNAKAGYVCHNLFVSYGYKMKNGKLTANKNYVRIDCESGFSLDDYDVYEINHEFRFGGYRHITLGKKLDVEKVYS